MTAAAAAHAPSRVRRGPRPVTAFAVAGIAFLALEAYILGAWLLSGDVVRVDTGPTEVPTWMTLMARGAELSGLVGMGAFAWVVLIRPWRNERRMTRDGMLTVIFFSLYWQDPLANYWRPWFLYNAELVNVSSWLGHVPGVQIAHADQFAVPVVYAVPQYVVTILGLTIVGGRALAWARRRWPAASTTRLVLGTYLVFVVIDLAVEAIVLTRLGFNTFAGATGPTLFSGHWYQFPLIESLVWPAAWTAFICLRSFTNDRNETLAERGSSELRGSERRRQGVRFLALTGACNAIMLLCFMLPINLIAAHARSWPEDVTTRSYFTSGTCGAGSGDPPAPCP